MAGQGNKRSAPHLPEAPPQTRRTASTPDEASTPACTWPQLHRAPAVRRRSDLGVSSSAPRATPPPRLGQCSPCPRATAGVVPGIWDAAAHSAAFPERWKVVSQSSGWRETSNTPTGLAEIFIHLHFQICSTFSLYKYMGSSWTLGLAEPSMPLFIWWTSCFSGLFI